MNLLLRQYYFFNLFFAFLPSSRDIDNVIFIGIFMANKSFGLIVKSSNVSGLREITIF